MKIININKARKIIELAKLKTENSVSVIDSNFDASNQILDNLIDKYSSKSTINSSNDSNTGLNKNLNINLKQDQKPNSKKNPKKNLSRNSDNKAKNSWGEVANWYEDLLTSPRSFQSNVILPNLQRLLDLKKTDIVLDLACGEGFFPAQFEKHCKLTGIDIAPELINLAREKCKNSEFIVAKAENIDKLTLPKFNKVYTVLAIQNIQGLNETFKNISSFLTPGGQWIIVMNHPAFRQLKNSEWLYIKEAEVQYRLLSKYMTSYKEEILMNPSKRETKKTLTYHRPLQEYIKVAKNNGLALTNMEEWISHIVQDTDYKETARKEFPMFMTLVFSKL